MVASAGGSNSAQRSFGAPPNNGTLATVATIPAWAASTAYVVDPSAGGINRVLNGGNLYQCRTAGTSASSGGPTGTGSNITDNAAHWSYEGAAPTTDTAAGSQILGIVARGFQSNAASIPPTDNDGGSYTAISNTSYSGFPDSFAGVFRRTTAANTKSGFTASAAFGNIGSTGQGDEMSVAWIELSGVTVGAPHAFSQVERSAATANVDTAASITTTVQCLIVSFWFGNGNQLTPGTSHVATPNGGLTLLPGATELMSLSNSGYIQFAAAWRIANAGTFSESWTTTGEGAQLVTVAFPVATALPGAEDDVPLSWPAAFDWRRVAAAAALVGQLAAQGTPSEELPITPTAAVEDDPVVGWVAGPRAVSWSGGGPAEELPAATAVVEEDPAPAAMAGQRLWLARAAAPDDEIVVAPPEEDSVAAPVRAARTWPTAAAFVSDDELAVSPPDDGVVAAATPTALTARRPDVAVDDEIVGTAVLEDEPTIGAVPGRPLSAVPAAFADDEIAQLPGLDDESSASTAPPVPARTVAPTLGVSEDELPALAAVEDDTGAAPLSVAVVRSSVLAVAPEDDLPIAASLTVEDDVAIAPAPRTAQLGLAPSAADEDLPIAAPLSIEDDPIGSPPASAPVLRSPSVLLADDELPAAAFAIDEDVASPTLYRAGQSPLAPLLAGLDDELPAIVTALDDDWGALAPLTPSRWSLRIGAFAPDDEPPPAPGVALTIEDDPLPAAEPYARRLRFLLFWVPEELAGGAAPPVVIIEPKGTRVQRTEIVVVLTPAPTVLVVHTAAVVRLVGVGMADPEPFRQGHTHDPLTAIAFTAKRLVDFPTEFPGGVTFRAVNGTHVIAGPAVGDGVGNLTYAWAPTDLDVIGHWTGYFEGTDADGKKQTFPRGATIEYDVVATI